LREKYVCLTGFFIGGHQPPSYFFSTVFSALNRALNHGKNRQENLGDFGQVSAVSKLTAVVPASRLEVRPVPEMVSSGIPQLDALPGGLARGCLTEICGTASSGRTSVLLFALAHATQQGEVCALVDACDAFDPVSAAAGMEMSRLLWVRCGEKYPLRKHPSAALTGKAGELYQGMSSGIPHDSYQGMPSGIPQFAEKGDGFSRCGATPLPSSVFFRNPLRAGSRAGEFSRWKNRWKNPEVQRWESQLGQMLKVTDLLLQSNGFGMIALDLGDVPVQSARRIPLASWFRFRRAVEHTPTALLVLEQQPIAGSCSSVLVRVSGARPPVSEKRLSALSSQEIRRCIRSCRIRNCSINSRSLPSCPRILMLLRVGPIIVAEDPILLDLIAVPGIQGFELIPYLLRLWRRSRHASIGGSRGIAAGAKEIGDVFRVYLKLHNRIVIRLRRHAQALLQP